VRRSTDWIRTVSNGEILPPAEVDLTRPSIARVYDYVLGGKDNFQVDRNAAQALMNAVPETPLIARDNRDFVRRAVSYLVAEAGIRQILDIGSGLPTVKNVHEIAQEIAPETKVAYVDNDPVVLTHGRVLLADNDNTTIITADVREPDSIFDDPGLIGYIDLSQPFAVLAAGLLHHLSDAERPDRIAAAIRNRLSPGSYLVISSFHNDSGKRAHELEQAFLHGGLGTGRFRPLEDQIGYFDGLEMVEPGVVQANDWRPDALTRQDSPVSTLYIGGVGRQP
jgi:hypothetical protein